MSNSATTDLISRMGSRLHLTDAGLETVLIFHKGWDLPQFASFPLVNTSKGREALGDYFNSFLDEAEKLDCGFVLDTPTWRASVGWGERMGWTADAIDRVNQDAVALMIQMRRQRGPAGRDIVINGTIGPHGDAYAPDVVLSADGAQAYHARQVRVLARSGVDLISAQTISSTGEAIGIARAAKSVGVPASLSFTVETDGRLISGMTLAQAIAETDAATEGYPAWYGINCAHPEHFGQSLPKDLAHRIGSLRANASRRSHAELDEATVLDDGDPEELGMQYRNLQGALPGLRVMGGCCGTDLRHVSAIGRQCSQRH